MIDNLTRRDLSVQVTEWICHFCLLASTGVTLSIRCVSPSSNSANLYAIDAEATMCVHAFMVAIIGLSVMRYTAKS